jgi:hypothetical protein
MHAANPAFAGAHTRRTSDGLAAAPPRLAAAGRPASAVRDACGDRAAGPGTPPPAAVRAACAVPEDSSAIAMSVTGAITSAAHLSKRLFITVSFRSMAATGTALSGVRR